MAEPIPVRVTLSKDRREMTVITQSTAGAHRAILGRGTGQEPFNDEDVRLADWLDLGEDAGVHRIVATCADGSTWEVRCDCDWCVVARAMWPRIRSWLRSVEPEYRPDWLPAGTGAVDPRAETERFADVRRIAGSKVVHGE